jgi:hypothetical protein
MWYLQVLSMTLNVRENGRGIQTVFNLCKITVRLLRTSSKLASFVTHIPTIILWPLVIQLASTETHTYDV